jgi:hypothetical protein
MMEPQPLNQNDVVELSDQAWTVVDPEGEHEAEERRFVEVLLKGPAGGFPLSGDSELRAHLATTVESVAGDLVPAHLQAVAAVITFLARHPERRSPDERVLGEALHDAFPRGIPPSVADWLRTRPELAEPPEPEPRPPGPRHTEH